MEAKPTPTGSSATLSPLTPDLHHGLTAVAFFASISLVSSSSLFVYFTYKLIRWRIRVSREERRERQAEAASQVVDLSLGLAQRHFAGDEERYQPAEAPPKRPRKSPNQFLILVYNLFLADTLQAVAFFINAVWVARDGIFVGTPACFLQGWLVSIGDLSSSCFIFAIAVHTYLSVVREYKAPQWVLYLTVVGLWLFVYGMTVIGLGATSNGYANGGYYVRASAWCWINTSYETYRLVNHYLFIFISLAATSITYLLIFLHLRPRNQLLGRSTTSRAISHSSRPSVTTLAESLHRSGTNKNSQSSLHDIRPTGQATQSKNGFRAAKHAEAKQTYANTKDYVDPETDVPSSRTPTSASYHPAFLLYPIIYVVCTLPLAAGRIATMAHLTVPYWYFCLAGALITSNGWLDCLLWGMTRRSLIFGSADDIDEEDTGLDTFTFMRTPRGRQFGNIVWVQGASLGAQNPDRSTGVSDKWSGFFGRKGVRLESNDYDGHGRSGSQVSLRGSDFRPRNERADNAIQMDLVTSVTVEQDPASRDAAERYRRAHGLVPAPPRKASVPGMELDKESNDMQFLTGTFR